MTIVEMHRREINRDLRHAAHTRPRRCGGASLGLQVRKVMLKVERLERLQRRTRRDGDSPARPLSPPRKASIARAASVEPTPVRIGATPDASVRPTPVAATPAARPPAALATPAAAVPAAAPAASAPAMPTPAPAPVQAGSAAVPATPIYEGARARAATFRARAAATRWEPRASMTPPARPGGRTERAGAPSPAGGSASGDSPPDDRYYV